MCSILGYISACSMDRVFHKMSCLAEERGRDAHGIIWIRDGDRTPLVDRKLGAYSLCTEHLFVGSGTVLRNLRAEPTTEYMLDKRADCMQPYSAGPFYVVHNGTIANDKELIKKWSLDPICGIDSAIIPGLLVQMDCGFNLADMRKMLEELVGSYALAVGHVDFPGEVILMTNYKPIYILREEDGGWVFASQESHFPQSELLRTKCTALPPYSMVKLRRGQDPEWCSIRVVHPEERAVVVCSGGLDSTVVATLAKEQYKDVLLLHFQYGCRAEGPEVEAVKTISAALNIPLKFIQTDVFTKTIQGSPLLDKSIVAGGKDGAEFAHEWVPARNLILLSITVGYAESHGYDVILLGNNLEESGAYPDNEPEFIHLLNRVLPFATQVNKHVRIEMPVGNLMKHEIVSKGLEIDAPMHLTWSCYHHGEMHCGQCGPCFMRKTAYEMISAQDSMEYAA